MTHAFQAHDPLPEACESLPVHLVKPSVTLRAGTQDEQAYRQVVLENEYRLPLRFKPDDQVVDVGAQIGCFAVACLERGAGHVWAFEPDPDSFKLLLHNLQRFDSSRWTARQAAVWRSDQPSARLRMIQPSPALTAMTHVRGVVGGPGREAIAPGEFEVDTVPLQAVLAKATQDGQCTVRLLKLDCEGSEFPLLFTTPLTGVQEVCLETHRVGDPPQPHFAVGDHPSTPEALKGHLEAQGFQVQHSPQPDNEVNQWLFAKRPRDARKPAKVMVFRFPFQNSEAPDVTDWLIQTACLIERDPRISDSFFCKIDDTPITMCRNIAIQQALDVGADLLVMVDNDMRPDLGLHPKSPIKGAVPFWESSFDFWWNHDGPCIVGAPYCGPPPHNNVFVFLWRARQNEPQQPEFMLRQYEREEAALLSGIRPVAALPTGLILIDMEVFQRMQPPWFYYEFPDARTQRKLSTEDVTFTRDAQLHGVPNYCNWSAWAGHYKRYLVGAPRPLCVEDIPFKFRSMCEQQFRQGVKLSAEGPSEHHRMV